MKFVLTAVLAFLVIFSVSGAVLAQDAAKPAPSAQTNVAQSASVPSSSPPPDVVKGIVGIPLANQSGEAKLQLDWDGSNLVVVKNTYQNRDQGGVVTITEDGVTIVMNSGASMKNMKAMTLHGEQAFKGRLNIPRAGIEEDFTLYVDKKGKK